MTSSSSGSRPRDASGRAPACSPASSRTLSSSWHTRSRTSSGMSSLPSSRPLCRSTALPRR
eukprot:1659691-Alexandrium_andersonii.AAC.1